MQYKVGDILYNPAFGDIWLVSERYNEGNEEDELYLKKVDYDYDEDIYVPQGFIRIGNIYDMIEQSLNENE